MVSCTVAPPPTGRQAMWYEPSNRVYATRAPLVTGVISGFVVSATALTLQPVPVFTASQIQLHVRFQAKSLPT
jgi:hypothetical protein